MSVLYAPLEWLGGKSLLNHVRGEKMLDQVCSKMDKKKQIINVSPLPWCKAVVINIYDWNLLSSWFLEMQLLAL